MALFRNVKVGLKTQIASIFILALLVVLIVAFFQINRTLSEQQRKNDTILTLSEETKALSSASEAYLRRELSLGLFKDRFEKYVEMESGMLDVNLDGFWETLTSAEALFARNDEIAAKVTELATGSIENSDTYITQTALRLADPGDRANVTDLERMVIIGASVNTAANYQIQLLFKDLQMDLSRKDEMIEFLDIAVENARVDVERLAGTPFEQLPKSAIANNIQAKDLVLEFVENKNQLDSIHETAQLEILSLEEKMSELQQGTMATSFSQVRSLFVIVLIIYAAISAFLVILQVLLSRSITVPLRQVSGVIREMEDGELDVKIPELGKDEVGEMGGSIQKMADRLKSVVSTVQEIILGVTSSSEQLSSTTQQLSEGASKQAASTEEVSSSMEEMSSNIQQNADNARETESIALEASQNAEDSGKAVTEAVTAMNEIAEKIGIIEEIARQTNMLALNAAIEAARAGEQGKGFAVVASEVRKLAERSQKAAGEIGTISNRSVEIAETAGEKLDALLPNIKKTADLVQEISAASSEQNAGVQQINRGMTDLDQVTQQYASSTEEISATAGSLKEQAERLLDEVSFFKLKQGAVSRKQHGVKALPETPKVEEVSGEEVTGITLAQEESKAEAEERPEMQQVLQDEGFEEF